MFDFDDVIGTVTGVVLNSMSLEEYFAEAEFYGSTSAMVEAENNRWAVALSTHWDGTPDWKVYGAVRNLTLGIISEEEFAQSIAQILGMWDYENKKFL